MTRIAGLALLFVLAAPARAEERIAAFDSVVRIERDGSMQVTESLDVVGENDRIRRGIFRDFPTDYRDQYGNRVRVGFDVLSVERDGHPEPWATERLANGVRLRIGDRNKYLGAGEFRYVLRYRTTRQVGFFDEHDELYWNVTGNGWEFAIERASAEVTLPAPVPAARLAIEGWTGALDSEQRAYEATLHDGGARIRTTAPLRREEGLTLAFSFPKGIVVAPARAQRVRWWAEDNLGMLLMGGTFVLVWLGYLWRWFRFGRDPAPGVVLPEYAAPDGLPPSVLRYVRAMGYEGDAFVADLMHLAQRGFLRITQDNDRFTVEKLRDADARDPIDAALMGTLFGASPQVVIGGEARDVLRAAKAKHEHVLRAAHEGRWFHRNGWTLAIGVLASMASAVAGFVLQGLDAGRMGLAVFAIAMLAISVGVPVSFALRGGNGKAGAIVLMTVVLLVPGAIAMVLLLGTAGVVQAAFIAAFVLTNALFAALLPAYTRAGRRLLDRIEGFVTYLSVAEKDDLARLHAPSMTGERFAQFLPYAQALDVEAAWARKLSDALGAAAAAEATRAAVGNWYHATGTRDFAPASFAKGVGRSFGNAISSSSTPPGSTSARSGGGGGSRSRSRSSGRSGRGGGGGGGGGW